MHIFIGIWRQCSTTCCKCWTEELLENTAQAHRDKGCPVEPSVMKSLLQLLSLCENWLQKIPDISRCHGGMYIQFVEGGFNLSR